MHNATITAVPGVLAGHWTHSSGTTGVTALLFPQGAAGGGVVPGSAPGSRELGALDPSHLAGQVHGFCFSGGSAFGLAAADGVMALLEERGIGFDAGVAKIPIVPAAILFDLHVAQARPDKQAGYLAAAAASDAPLAVGRVGAGAGGTVAKLTGAPQPGGLGSGAARVGPYTVGVVVALNAAGSVRDPDTGRWIAGDGSLSALPEGDWRGNTTLAAVATDAPLSRAQCTVLARMASAAFARCLWPAFAPIDGDTVLVASTGRGEPVGVRALARLGDAAARSLSDAILRAARSEAS